MRRGSGTILFWAVHLPAALLATPLAVGGLLAGALLTGVVLTMGGQP